jgi:hypothetical protein
MIIIFFSTSYTFRVFASATSDSSCKSVTCAPRSARNTRDFQNRKFPHEFLRRGDPTDVGMAVIDDEDEDIAMDWRL